MSVSSRSAGTVPRPHATTFWADPRKFLRVRTRTRRRRARGWTGLWSPDPNWNQMIAYRQEEAEKLAGCCQQGQEIGRPRDRTLHLLRGAHRIGTHTTSQWTGRGLQTARLKGWISWLIQSRVWWVNRLCFELQTQWAGEHFRKHHQILNMENKIPLIYPILNFHPLFLKFSF